MFVQNWDLEEMFDWILFKLKQRNEMYEIDEDERASLTWEIRIVNMLSYEDEGLYDKRQYSILEASVGVYEDMEFEEFQNQVIQKEEVVQEYKTQGGWMNRYKKEVEQASSNDYVYHTGE